MSSANGRTATLEATDRPVPYDIGAEQAVIGALILDRDAIVVVAVILEPGDFYLEKNGWIFEAILALYNRREPPDLQTLSSELKRRERLEAVGGIAYLGKVMRRPATAVHVEYYARIVYRASVCRRVISAGGQIAALGYEEGLETPDMLGRVNGIILGVDRRGGLERLIGPTQAVAAHDERMVERATLEPGEVAGLATGIERFDRITGGLQPKRLYMVAARPSVGKSALACNVVRAVCEAGKRVLIFSLEMSAEEIVGRWVSDLANINSLRLESGRLDDDEMPRLVEAQGRIGNWGFSVDETPGLSISELTRRATAAMMRDGYDLIVVDHLHLMNAGLRDNRNLELGLISSGLKALAKELRLPVLALAQLNRQVENRANHEPTLADLRESGNLEQDGDVIGLLHRPELYADNDLDRANLKGIATLIVAKNRNLPTRKIPLHWDGGHTRFMNVTGREQEA